MRDAVDLHVHTVHSDGTATPAAVVAGAVAAGLVAIAVTDHDTVAGLAEALAAGEKDGMTVVPGVELTAESQGAEVHIVGLFIDPADPALTETLERKRAERADRVEAMAQRLAALGRPVDLAAVLAEAPPASLSRTHLAEAMRRAGYVADVAEAFDYWLGEGGPAYLPRPRFTVPAACALVRAAGGLPVLAHPGDLKRETLVRLAADGVAALEAYNPGFEPGYSRRLRRWARELDLGISGGSDFHGRHRCGADIGSVRVPTVYFEDLKRRTRHVSEGSH